MVTFPLNTVIAFLVLPAHAVSVTPQEREPADALLLLQQHLGSSAQTRVHQAFEVLKPAPMTAEQIQKERRRRIQRMEREAKAKGCPVGFYMVNGDVPGFDQFGREKFRAETIESCAEDCQQKPTCKSFEWSPNTHFCNANMEAPEKLDKPYQDFLLCVRNATGGPISTELSASNSTAAVGMQVQPKEPVAVNATQATPASSAADAAPASTDAAKAEEKEVAPHQQGEAKPNEAAATESSPLRPPVAPPIVQRAADLTEQAEGPELELRATGSAELSDDEEAGALALRAKLEQQLKLKKDEDAKKQAEARLRGGPVLEEAPKPAVAPQLAAAEPVVVAKPNAIDTEPAKNEEAVAKPVEAAAKPEEATVKPEAPAKPEEPIAKPVEAAVQPEEAVAKPEKAAAKPEEAAVKPEEAAAKPEEAIVKLEEAIVKTEEAAAKPERAAAKPEKAVKPEAVVKPEEATAKPEEVAAKPEKAAIKPKEAAAIKP